MHVLVLVSSVEILGHSCSSLCGLSIMNMNMLWCYSSMNSMIDRTGKIALHYFSMNSWIDRTKRIALRWFSTLQTIPTIHIALVSPSLHRTSAPIQFAIVLGVLGTQEIACIWLQGHLRETHSSYTSHGLINLRSSTWGKIATVLQNSALGGPTRVYKNKVA